MTALETGPCEGCGTVTRLRLLLLGPEGEEWWVCQACRSEWRPPPPRPDR